MISTIVGYEKKVITGLSMALDMFSEPMFASTNSTNQAQFNRLDVLRVLRARFFAYIGDSMLSVGEAGTADVTRIISLLSFDGETADMVLSLSSIVNEWVEIDKVFPFFVPVSTVLKPTISVNSHNFRLDNLATAFSVLPLQYGVEIEIEHSLERLA